MTMRWMVVGLLVLTGLVGCKREREEARPSPTAPPAAPASTGPAVTMTLTRPQVRPNEAIAVTFGAPLVPPANQQYWVTIIPVGQPDDAWGSWQYLPVGATQATLATPDPGLHEIRLHDYYPHHPHRVIARQQVTVLP